MSDVQDPLEDSFEHSLPEIIYPEVDKRIVFGARKPTEDIVSLSPVPFIIEAPFPYERTLHWSFGSSLQDTEGDVDEQITDPPSEQSLGHSDVAEPGISTEEKLTSSLPESAGQIAIIVSQEVLLKVSDHVSQSLERELGGFLLGNRYRCPNTQRDYVIIDQVSPAKFTESTDINLAFTHEAWAQLSDELSGKFLGKLVIGWYHSHPRMDVFLSSHDMDIQTERFPEPWKTALVLEPEKHLGGFFCARDGRINPNSPVDFFELLERNSRTSVVAWENYSAIDPVTNSAPIISATNTASAVNIQEQETADSSSQNQPAPLKRRSRRRFLISLGVIVVLVAALGLGVAKTERLKRWWGLVKNRVVMQ